jgi:hypothetical protein
MHPCLFWIAFQCTENAAGVRKGEPAALLSGRDLCVLSTLPIGIQRDTLEYGVSYIDCPQGVGGAHASIT